MFLFPSMLSSLCSPLLQFSYFHAGPPARVIHMSSELCEMAVRLKAEKMKSKGVLSHYSSGLLPILRTLTRAGTVSR